MAPQARGDNHDAKRLEGELEKLEKVGGSKLAELIRLCEGVREESPARAT
jgi:hypothetical protein